MSLKVQELTKIYGEQKAVDHISFEAGKGEILGFLGPNGAGKSTTMKIATCYIPPTSGVVTVAGYDVVESPLEVRKNVGYLPEHNPLYLDMYVHEYLEFIGSLHSLKGSKLKGRVQEMVEMTGLTLEQNKKLGALSKGYRQRVGLAQAMIHEPQVLILDEPTTGLDPNQILEIRNLIKNIGKEKTVLFSTHIMQEVQALCDRVVIINRGKIVADNRVSELKGLQASGKKIIVEFSGEIEVEYLKSLSGVNEVKQTAGGKYELLSSGENDVRGAIFKLASERNWTLIGLNQEEHSLENIFRDLTGKKNDSI
ncbi:MAG: gliding motility-associated ABC transporter ATP-binding subunit GldA [Sporocytophaga sp.]|uniref:gliding motility-associated ABC transporter ATP-binding subunit GldA n=1 Tax=Sporocytophaga sp. TaxID=2231183 RepID=UPI001B0F2CD1|nr:gliding motility-associated ABC transporter ATP-binding subunit GldA [Sporocytophaga sp.]MBO9701226.1 gliding motility-associated ABC transporter ATP-binding subunit GldA [Sporocytophaga sp.]